MTGFEWVGETDDEYELGEIHVENGDEPDEFAIFDAREDMSNDVWIVATGDESFVECEKMR